MSGVRTYNSQRTKAALGALMTPKANRSHQATAQYMLNDSEVHSNMLLSYHTKRKGEQRLEYFQQLPKQYCTLTMSL